MNLKMPIIGTYINYVSLVNGSGASGLALGCCSISDFFKDLLFLIFITNSVAVSRSSREILLPSKDFKLLTVARAWFLYSSRSAGVLSGCKNGQHGF